VNNQQTATVTSSQASHWAAGVITQASFRLSGGTLLLMQLLGTKIR